MEEQVKRWRKKPRTGRHLLRIDGQKVTVLPGGVVTCPASCLGAAIHKYDCLGVVGGEREVIDITNLETEEPQKVKTLLLRPRGRGWFDIVNPDNPTKPLNSKAMKEEEAKEVLGQMLEELK